MVVWDAMASSKGSDLRCRLWDDSQLKDSMVAFDDLEVLFFDVQLLSLVHVRIKSIGDFIVQLLPHV